MTVATARYWLAVTVSWLGVAVFITTVMVGKAALALSAVLAVCIAPNNGGAR